jgi:hypothetical protein
MYALIDDSPKNAEAPLRKRDMSRADRLAILSTGIGIFLHSATSHVSEPHIRNELHAALAALDHAIQLLVEADAEKAESNNAPKAATPTK